MRFVIAEGRSLSPYPAERIARMVNTPSTEYRITYDPVDDTVNVMVLSKIKKL